MRACFLFRPNDRNKEAKKTESEQSVSMSVHKTY